MANIMEIKEYDKVVRRFVDDYVNNLTPDQMRDCLLYTSPSPRDGSISRMPSSA